MLPETLAWLGGAAIAGDIVRHANRAAAPMTPPTASVRCPLMLPTPFACCDALKQRTAGDAVRGPRSALPTAIGIDGAGGLLEVPGRARAFQARLSRCPWGSADNPRYVKYRRIGTAKPPPRTLPSRGC